MTCIDPVLLNPKSKQKLYFKYLPKMTLYLLEIPIFLICLGQLKRLTTLVFENFVYRSDVQTKKKIRSFLEQAQRTST